MASRVLMTGATGLIGKAALKNLTNSGHSVVAISRNRQVDGATETIVADLLDPIQRSSAVKKSKATHLLHLAWHGSANDRWTGAANVDWAAATLQLVREFADQGGTRAVCAGSCAEYDWTHECLSESTPLFPSTLYGRAKASTGELLTSSADEMGLKLAWARIFFCYGSQEPRGRLLGDLLNGLSAGKRVACTDGSQMRDFLHVDDIGAALEMLVHSETDGAINIASGTAHAVKELVDITAQLMGHPDLIDFGAIAQPADTPNRLVADISKLAATGFKPKFDLKAGLTDCVTAFQNQNKQNGSS